MRCLAPARDGGVDKGFGRGLDRGPSRAPPPTWRRLGLADARVWAPEVPGSCGRRWPGGGRWPGRVGPGMEQDLRTPSERETEATGRDAPPSATNASPRRDGGGGTKAAARPATRHPARRPPERDGGRGTPPTAKRGRGRPKAGPRVRPHSRTGEYLVLGMGETIHTGTWDREEAELRLARERLRVAEPGLVPPDRSVPLRKVIEHARARARAGAVPHLLAFWGNVRLDEMSRAACWAYEDYRREQTDGGRGGREGPAIGTIRNELANLTTMVRAYCEDEGIVPAPKVYLPADEPTARRFLRVHEVKRLELAAQGCAWDAEAGAWRRGAGRGRPRLVDAAARERLLPMARLVPTLAWTGSRVDSVLRATWSRRGDRGWVDMRIGILFRKGDEEAATSKGRPPVRLTDRLLGMFGAWVAEDAASRLDDVVHDASGRPLTVARAWLLFSELRERAGLDASVTLRTLRSSCAVWLMEKGLTVEEAADFLGNTAKTLSAFYDHYAPGFSHAAADALDSREY